MNKVLLIGNLGADPEIKRTNDGRAIGVLNVATSESWRDKASGERKEKTEWHRVVIFNEGICKVAEQYLKKGMKVYIEGVLRTIKWKDQGGADRYTTQVNIENFSGTLTMLTSNGGNRPPVEGADEDHTRPGVAGRPIPGRNAGNISSGKPDDIDDEIPF